MNAMHAMVNIEARAIGTKLVEERQYLRRAVPLEEGL